MLMEVMVVMARGGNGGSACRGCVEMSKRFLSPRHHCNNFLLRTSPVLLISYNKNRQKKNVDAGTDTHTPSHPQHDKNINIKLFLLIMS